MIESIVSFRLNWGTRSDFSGFLVEAGSVCLVLIVTSGSRLAAGASGFSEDSTGVEGMIVGESMRSQGSGSSLEVIYTNTRAEKSG